MSQGRADGIVDPLSSQPWPATLVVGWRDATGNLGSTTVTTGALVS
jgi:hypothetical protein